MGELILTSAKLTRPHGFTTRHGGVSEGPYASFNLSLSVGDAPEAVRENAARLMKAVGLKGLATATQVHGAQVITVEAGADPLIPIAEADALLASAPGAGVAVRTADCVPILIEDPRRGAVAAVHSGWRGTDLKIAARAIEALAAQGSKPEELCCAIGPSIRGCCYQVSAELAARFEQGFGHDVALTRGEARYLDLVAAVRLTLIAAGVGEGQIDEVAPCTSCDPRFFSHRRDRGTTGRQLSFIAAV